MSKGGFLPSILGLEDAISNDTIDLDAFRRLVAFWERAHNKIADDILIDKFFGEM